jgi:signal transduction histidine kinase/CheY-like chemotaxis protein
MRIRGALLGGLLLVTVGGGAPTGAVPSGIAAAVAAPIASRPGTTDRPARGDASSTVAHRTLPPVRLPRTLATVLLLGGILAFVMLVAALLALRRTRDRIAADNAELRQANATLETALKARTEFLTTTSHEIRTPLNGILGMTQVLLTDGRIDRNVRDRISLVQGAGESMKALVDDLLDMAKIDGGQLTFEHLPMDLYALIEEVGRLWRGQAEAKGLRIDLDLHECPITIEGDCTRIRQILFNLLSNALKFTARGSIAVSAFAEPGSDGEVLVLRVRDSGIGIELDQQARVFERFCQADATITRRFGGTGLGLPICRSLIEAMGGTIAVESRLGEGATFTVRLPLRRIADAPPARPPETKLALVANARRLDEARLLIVEQNALTRRILCNMLEHAAGGIEAVATIQEARDRLAAGGIDHVIADTATGAGDPAGRRASLDRLASRAGAVGARMTLLFPPRLTPDAAQLVAARPDVQALAKPIAATALVEALGRCYPPILAESRREHRLAVASMAR